MDQRPRLKLPFGEGLDRATGVAVVDPRSWVDLRNLIVYDGRAQVRPGITAIANLGGTVSEVIAAAPFRSRGTGIIVSYDSTTGHIQAWETTSLGASPTLIGTWFDPETAVGVPRVILAEANKKMFFAHEYELLKPGATYLRGKTYVYNGSTFVALTADLDRSGSAEDLRFRGVVSYLDYLVAWGYGTGTDEDRPDVVRVSDPGDAATFNPDHYFIAGAQGEPVTTCAPAGQVLLVYKPGTTYKITGRNRAEFGIFVADEVHGCASPRLQWTYGGVSYAWSYDGPRANAGGASIDLAVPLDLDAPDPAELVESGDISLGFALPYPKQRLILWLFPNPAYERTRVYCLSLKYPSRPRWSYWELQQRVNAGGLFFAPSAIVPPGYPDIDTITPSFNTADVSWDNISALGDEVIEIWLKPDGGVWAIAAEVDTTGASMSHELTDLDAETDYDIALRHRRGGLYNDGAEDASDPSAWPAASVSSFTTDSPATGPTTFDVDSCTPTWYGGKLYAVRAVSWTDDPGADGWEIVRNSVDNPETGTVAYYGNSGNAGTITTLIESPGSDLYFWVRYVYGGTYSPGSGWNGTGSRSDPTALTENPIDTSDACT